MGPPAPVRGGRRGPAHPRGRRAPDGFSATGQLWGNPLYRWDASAAEDHAWWRRARLGCALALTDRVRIDHFRAFSAYWAVPPTPRTPARAPGEPGPGQAFFDRMAQAFGPDLPRDR
ncbi:MAG: 4-alpha-glucanotransferase [Myxococcales bacterium]|nr:4-alpha-glucanotransferase [Myxococcales bacterium]